MSAEPIGAKPKDFMLAGVMGWPVLHSRSPIIHNHWLAEHGIKGRYVPLPIAPERLGAALNALAPLGFAGVNLTIPHKEAALPLMHTLDDAARTIGAVNCVCVHPDGTLEGRNTDAFGFMAALRESQPGWRADAGPAIVIGAGGAARAILFGLLDAGVPEIRLVNRSPAKAHSLARAFGPRVKVIAWDQRAPALDGVGLLVNSTSLGMAGEPELDLVLDALPLAAIVYDIVYVPRKTALLDAARRRGSGIVEGLDMLLHQARPAFAAWTGIMPDVSTTLRAEIDATF